MRKDLRWPIVVLATSLALPGGFVGADWPLARHDARRTGQATGTSDIVRPTAYWKHYLGGALAAPAFLVADLDVDGASEFLMIAGGAIVAKTRSDTVVWSTPLLELTAFVGLVDLDGAGGPDLIARSRDRVYVLDPSSGSIRWAEPAGEMGTIGATRLGDLDGDGLPELVILECGCCSVISDTPGVVRSFASGVASPTVLWQFPLARCGGQESLALVDSDGSGVADVLFGDRNELVLLDGTSGAELARSPQLGVSVQRSRCTAAEVDGSLGEEMVCVLSVPNDPEVNDRKVFVLRRQTAQAQLEVVWSAVLAVDTGELHWVDLVTDLDGDGNRELVLSASDDGQTWATHVLDAASGTPIGVLAGEQVAGIAPAASGAILLTSSETHLAGWRSSSGTIFEDWSILDALVQPTFDLRQAARTSIATRAMTAHVDDDGLADVLTVRRSNPGTIVGYGVSAGDAVELARYQMPAGVTPQRMWPVADPGAADLELAIVRNDGILGLFRRGLAPALGNDDASEIRLHTGGYYASGWRRVDNTPRAARLNGAADRILVNDSRGVLVVLDAATASFAAPPALLWEVAGGTAPSVIRQADDSHAVACLIVDQPVTTPPTYSVALVDADGAERWRRPIPARPENDPIPGNFDDDDIPDLVVQWGDPVDVLLQTRALRGSDGTTLWNAAPIEPGAGRQPAGIAVASHDGDFYDDVYHQAGRTQVLSGASGSELATSAPGPAYFMPSLVDLDVDTELEVVLHGGSEPVRVMDHDLATAMFISADNNRPYPFGAVADCGPDRKVLVEGSAQYPARLKLTELTGAATGQEQWLVLAGGAAYADEASALAGSAMLGQLTATSVHRNLSGDGSAGAVVGSTDGWLYGVAPCTGALAFSHDLGTPVGEAVFGDTDGDGRDEILVTASDGYLYDLRNFELDAPGAVSDTDPWSDVGTDLEDLATESTLEATWAPVPGAASYEVAVVDADSRYVGSPAWRDAGPATTLLLTGLPLVNGAFYRVSVRALSQGGGRSVDTVSDGLHVTYPPGPDAGGGIVYPPAGGCCRASGRHDLVTALLVLLVVGLLRRRR